ncbi:MobC family plasmid mobilization relaxosome protein [Salmonella enterica]|nr:MobC family plasmid mobilization relaxosome protein [Salmonella enterica]
MLETDRKRGRIKIDDEERRSISVQFRVNKKEFEYLKELVNSSGIERGHYIRKQILKSDVVIKRQMPEVNKKTYQQLCSIGNNINQIAKSLNSNESFDSSKVYETNFSIKQISKRLLEIQNDLDLK